ncbi:MAG: hypothetical protein ACK2U6_06960 [Candidatus Promineifilaceae bacterium]|jgi:hypothetical protein
MKKQVYRSKLAIAVATAMFALIMVCVPAFAGTDVNVGEPSDDEQQRTVVTNP